MGSDLGICVNRHVAANEKCQTTEHRLLRQVGLIGDQGSDAIGGLLVAGHGNGSQGGRHVRHVHEARLPLPASVSRREGSESAAPDVDRQHRPHADAQVQVDCRRHVVRVDV
jgi:hypothetical protein